MPSQGAQFLCVAPTQRLKPCRRSRPTEAGPPPGERAALCLHGFAPWPGPAEARSDHYSFQLHGFPACRASEELFAGPGPDAPPEEMNPNYHMATDTVLNAEYAADITAW